MLTKHFDERLLARSELVDRVPFTSPQQIAELARQNKPAILTGALSDWPALNKWRPEYFREMWGSQELAAYETKWQGRTPYSFVANQFARKRALDAFLACTASGDVYIPQLDAATRLPGSSKDLNFDVLVEGISFDEKIQPKIWLGTAGTRSGLHFDPADNLVAMFFGMKGFMLIPPGHPKWLYPFRENPSKSRIDPFNVDWKSFPRLNEATVYIDTILSGEVLLVPSKWWHYFTAMEFSINATCWFSLTSSCAQETRPPLLAYLYYLSKCGLAYPLQLIKQFTWNGVLQQPYEMKALSSPPYGARLWQDLRRRWKSPSEHT